MKKIILISIIFLSIACAKDKENEHKIIGNWMLNEQIESDGTTNNYYKGNSIEYIFSDIKNNTGDFSAYNQATGSSTSDKFELSEDEKMLTIIVLSASGANSAFTILEFTDSKLVLKNQFVKNTFYKI